MHLVCSCALEKKRRCILFLVLDFGFVIGSCTRDNTFTLRGSFWRHAKVCLDDIVEDTLKEKACWFFLPHEGFPRINLVYLFLLEILFMLPLLSKCIKYSRKSTWYQSLGQSKTHLHKSMNPSQGFYCKPINFWSKFVQHFLARRSRAF